MALNFGILQPVNIGGQIMAGEQEAQRNQLAQQQLKTGEMQQEKAGLELRRFKRGQDGLDVFLRESTANGKTGSPEAQTDSFYKFALTQGDPTLIMAAQQLNQAAKERSAYQAGRTPGALAAPAIAPTPELPGVTVGGPNPPTVFGAAPMPTANRLALPPAPAASVNRLGVDTNALQTRIDELRSTYPNVPQALKEADRLEKQLDESRKLFSVGGNLVTGGGDVRYTAPEKVTESEFERNLAKSGLPEDQKTAFRIARARKESTFGPGVTVTMPVQEKSFESGLGKGQSDRILANQVAAQDAAEILRTNQVGRDLLKSGAITGAGADFLVSLNNALKQVGIDFGYADAAANSQAYVAALGSNVGRIIKQFGAGTGLSDADREYAAQIAGGKIALTEAALRKILDINDRASNRVIDLHNKNVGGIKTNIPLTVEKPTFTPPAPSGASLIPTSTPVAAGGATVTLPDGRIKTFPNADAANKFKKAAGL